MPLQIHSQKFGCSRVLSLWLMVTLAVLALIASLGIGHAQLSIQIGGSEADYKAALSRAGYDRIDTVKIGLSNSSFDACKDGKRYRVRFEWTGQSSTKVIGDCRIILTQEQVTKILETNGYNRISIEDRAGKFLAIGCLATVRNRVELNYYGDIVAERRIGFCANELTPTDITAKLESEGYDRVNFINRRPPLYVANACQDRTLMELKIDVFGTIRESRILGRCKAGMEPGDIVKSLEERGLTQVVMIDNRLPRYVAEACRGNYRVQITMNRWGDISDEIRIGDCRIAFTVAQVKDSMRANGYKNVSVTVRNSQFVTKGCRDNRYNEIILSQFGELVTRRDLGSCDAPKINDLAELLRQRGMDDLTFFVEGCENKSRVRLTFDEFANRTNREVIGGC